MPSGSIKMTPIFSQKHSHIYANSSPEQKLMIIHSGNSPQTQNEKVVKDECEKKSVGTFIKFFSPHIVNVICARTKKGTISHLKFNCTHITDIGSSLSTGR